MQTLFCLVYQQDKEMPDDPKHHCLNNFQNQNQKEKEKEKDWSDYFSFIQPSMFDCYILNHLEKLSTCVQGNEQCESNIAKEIARPCEASRAF